MQHESRDGKAQGRRERCRGEGGCPEAFHSCCCGHRPALLRAGAEHSRAESAFSEERSQNTWVGCCATGNPALPIPRGSFPLLPAASALKCGSLWHRVPVTPRREGSSSLPALAAHWQKGERGRCPCAGSHRPLAVGEEVGVARASPALPLPAALHSLRGAPGRAIPAAPPLPLAPGSSSATLFPASGSRGGRGSRSGRGGGRCRPRLWSLGRPAWHAREPRVSVPYGRRRLAPGRPQVGARGWGAAERGTARPRGEAALRPGRVWGCGPRLEEPQGRCQSRAASSREKPCQGPRAGPAFGLGREQSRALVSRASSFQ